MTQATINGNTYTDDGTNRDLPSGWRTWFLPLLSDLVQHLASYLASLGGAMVATSSTNDVAIGSGSLSLTVQANKAFAVGSWITATDSGNAANWVIGKVTAYNVSTGVLTFTVASGDTSGSSTPAGWTVVVSGKRGAIGAAGAPGADGLMTAASNAETVAGTLTTKAVTPASAVATFLKLAGGTLTGALQTIAGTVGSLALQVGEATSGLYLQATGCVGFVAAGIEVFRTAATGVLTFFKATRSSVVTVTDAATVTLDLNAGNKFDWTLGGNRTLANPTNMVAGQTFMVALNWTGANTLSLGSYFKPVGGTTLTYSSANGKTDRLHCEVVSSTAIHTTVLKGF